MPYCGHILLVVEQVGTTFAVEEDGDNSIDPEVLYIPESSVQRSMYIAMYKFYTTYIDNYSGDNQDLKPSHDNNNVNQENQESSSMVMQPGFDKL